MGHRTAGHLSRGMSVGLVGANHGSWMRRTASAPVRFSLWLPSFPCGPRRNWPILQAVHRPGSDHRRSCLALEKIVAEGPFGAYSPDG